MNETTVVENNEVHDPTRVKLTAHEAASLRETEQLAARAKLAVADAYEEVVAHETMLTAAKEKLARVRGNALEIFNGHLCAAEKAARDHGITNSADWRLDTQSGELVRK